MQVARNPRQQIAGGQVDVDKGNHGMLLIKYIIYRGVVIVMIEERNEETRISFQASGYNCVCVYVWNPQVFLIEHW